MIQERDHMIHGRGHMIHERGHMIHGRGHMTIRRDSWYGHMIHGRGHMIYRSDHMISEGGHMTLTWVADFLVVHKHEVAAVGQQFGGRVAIGSVIEWNHHLSREKVIIFHKIT